VPAQRAEETVAVGGVPDGGGRDGDDAQPVAVPDAVEEAVHGLELLAILAGEPGRVFGRDELLDLVWGRDGFVEPRTVDVHLARLRGKFLGAKLPAPDVETVRGVGYRFREPEKGSA
jgi:DNA-binding response OmpR family regulator